MDFARSGKSDEGDFPGIARFEADCGAGWDIEAESAGGFAVEVQQGIHFVKMKVASDLHGAVSTVGDWEGFLVEILVDENVSVWVGKDFAGDHRIGW
jgi:hypothetical protein